MLPHQREVPQGADQSLIGPCEAEGRGKFDGDGNGIAIQVRAAPGSPGLSLEDAKELGEKVAGWIIDRKSGPGKRERDVMYS
jgi:hypothetical protein